LFKASDVGAYLGYRNVLPDNILIDRSDQLESVATATAPCWDTIYPTLSDAKSDTAYGNSTN